MIRKTLIRPCRVDWEDHTGGEYPLLYNCNIYFGCQHDCSYCYSKKMMYWKRPWREAEPVENAVELARKEVKRKKLGRIMFSSMCDPYMPLEKDLELARRVLEILLESKFLVLIMTKSDLVMRDYDIIQKHENVEVGFTITALKRIPHWEPEAPGNTRRIAALKKAHELGIKTFVSMEPTIPGVTQPIKIMEALRRCVDRWIIGSLNYCGVDFNFYRKEAPKWAEYIEKEGLTVKWKRELKPYLRV